MWIRTAPMLLGIVLALPSQADVLQVSARPQLLANDFIDWHAVGPAFTLVPDGSAWRSDGGLLLTVNNALEPGTPFRVFDQVPPVVTGFWNGNFAPGAAVLAPNGRPGSTLISFATPVRGAGAQIQAGKLDLPFTAVLDVTDTLGRVHSFSAPGFSSSLADDSAIFIGARSDLADIVSIRFSATGLSAQDNGPGINRLDIAAVPEPQTLVLMLAGLLLTVGAVKRSAARAGRPRPG